MRIVTWNSYSNIVKNHLIPYFKPLELSIKDLKSKHVSNYYEYEVLNDKYNKPLSYTTLKTLSTVLKNALNQAVAEELITRNPAFRISLHKRDSNNIKAEFLTAKEANGY